jgi:hypothetical protein
LQWKSLIRFAPRYSALICFFMACFARSIDTVARASARMTTLPKIGAAGALKLHASVKVQPRQYQVPGESGAFRTTLVPADVTPMAMALLKACPGLGNSLMVRPSDGSVHAGEVGSALRENSTQSFGPCPTSSSLPTVQ